jgi:hypothetical protein
MQLFKDDAGYLQWVDTHPGGFVLNRERAPHAGELMLHRTTCNDIRTPKRTNWTTTTYVKICSLDRAELETLAAQDGRELRGCLRCNP